MVRCLGDSDREHFFNSPDRVRIRICPKCKVRMEGSRVSPRAAVVKVKTEG